MVVVHNCSLKTQIWGTGAHTPQAVTLTRPISMQMFFLLVSLQRLLRDNICNPTSMNKPCTNYLFGHLRQPPKDVMTHVLSFGSLVFLPLQKLTNYTHPELKGLSSFNIIECRYAPETILLHGYSTHIPARACFTHKIAKLVNPSNTCGSAFSSTVLFFISSSDKKAISYTL